MESLTRLDEKVYSVSELTGEVKETIEGSFPNILVKGEVSNLKKHSSGHYYFTLKDNWAQLSCVMWKWRNMSMSFVLEDGMEVCNFKSILLFNYCFYIFPDSIG